MGRKQKKEKIVYVDDGRTIADMSGVTGGMPKFDRNSYAPRASLKEQFATFWNAMKMMFLPMLAVVGGILVIYVLMYIFFSLM